MAAMGRPTIRIFANQAQGTLWMERVGDPRRYILYTGELFVAWVKAIGVTAGPKGK